MRFYNFGDRQQVWSARSKLAGTSFGVAENFNGETEYNRKKLYPIFKAAKKMQKYENKVYMYEDTLVLNNIRYTVNDLDNLPDDVHPKKFCTKSNDTTEVFGGILSEYSVLSNWSPSKIEYNNHVYVNLEQAYMHVKAMENDDIAAARRIRYTKDPREIKRIGSNLTMNNKDKWETIRHGVMHDLVKAKFMQNNEMAQELIQRSKRVQPTRGWTVAASTQHKLYSLLLPPAMGARFYRFLVRPAKWTRWLAGAAAIKSG